MLFVVYKEIELSDEEFGDGWRGFYIPSYQGGMFRRKGREDDV